MPLTPGEADRLLLHLQAQLARSRRERGLRLNIPEASALIADAVCEWARDGLSWIQARDRARSLLDPSDVLPGVLHALTEVRVEARFDDGTRLVVVRDPFSVQSETAPEDEPPLDTGATIDIRNESATDIGISSHIHLAEINPRLRLDRAAAFGMRAAIPTGSTMWIPAGSSREVPMTPITGERIAIGTTGLVDGALDDPDARARALDRLRECGFLDVRHGAPIGEVESAELAVANVMQMRRIIPDQPDEDPA